MEFRSPALALAFHLGACALLARVAPVRAAQAESQEAGDLAPAPEPGTETGAASRNLFQSDMSLMTGMIPTDRGMHMPGWHVMDLGVATASFNRQGGPSGGIEFESSNWNMLHVQKTLGPGRLSLMMMNSLEPATFPKAGSRELFQTGESYRSKPLVDRQHPHDFFMNLSATYRLDLSADAGAWLQLAPVGEPALGPTAFMHRASAGENRTAPIGHHWEDSTHIAYNVVTLGAGWKWIGLEASVFHGQEPDEHRWNIDGGKIDSASVRARFFLGQGWSGQVSYGFLKDPESLEPEACTGRRPRSPTAPRATGLWRSRCSGAETSRGTETATPCSSREPSR